MPETMESVNSAHLNKNTNALAPTTSIPQSLYSGSFGEILATSADSLVPIKTSFGGEYLTYTSRELQNGQLKPTNIDRDKEMPTKCFICGQPTNCCHYDVPSCAGCRAFFRRSLFTSNTFTCQLNGMCSKINEINPCRACRLDRCILAGMNPRAIKFSTSFDVVKLSDKVSDRRRYLLQKYGEICPVIIRKTGPVFVETIEDKIIQSLVYVELKVQKIRESSQWPSESVRSRSLRELLGSKHENVLAHADQYPKEIRWPFTRTSDIDDALKFEMMDGRPNWLMLDMFLCIEMARTMPVFSQLDYYDQEALLKQILLANTLLLRAFYSYQMKSETLVMPNGFYPTKPPKDYRMEGIIDMIKLYSCRTMVAISRIQMTMEEFVLVKAVIYSHSAIHGLSDRGRVLLEKESIRYSKTLMKHLQSRMGAAAGAKKYAEIVFFVESLFHCAQHQREIHVYMANVLRLPHCTTPYIETIMYA